MSEIAIRQARDLLQRWEDGDLDNAFEGFQEAQELLEKLPHSETELRSELQELSDFCGETLAEVYGE